MIRIVLLTSLIIVGTIAEAQGWSATGPNGDDGSSSASCSSDDRAYACSASRSWTSPDGRTATRDPTRNVDENGVTVTRNATGLQGRRASGTRIRTR